MHCCLISLFYNNIYFNAENTLEERSIRRASLEASLRDVLFQIIRFVNDKKEHVPPIPKREGVISFPYEIAIPRSVDLVSQPIQTIYEFISVWFLNFRFIKNFWVIYAFLLAFYSEFVCLFAFNRLLLIGCNPIGKLALRWN